MRIFLVESILKPEQRMYLILSLVSDLRDGYAGKEDRKTDYQIASRIYANAFANLIRYGCQPSYEERYGVAFLTLGLEGRIYSCPARTVKNIMKSEFATVEEKLSEILPLLEAEENRIAEAQKSRKRRGKAKAAEDGAQETPQPVKEDAAQGQPAEAAGKAAQDRMQERKDAAAQAAIEKAAQKPLPKSPVAAAKTNVKEAEAPATPEVPDIPTIPAVSAMPDGKDAAPEHSAKPDADTGAAKATPAEPAQEPVTAGEDTGSHEDGPEQFPDPAPGPLHKAAAEGPVREPSTDSGAGTLADEGKAGTVKDGASKEPETAEAEAAPATQEGPGSGKLPEATEVPGAGEELKGKGLAETSGSHEGDPQNEKDVPIEEAGASHPAQPAPAAPHVFRKKEKTEAEPPAAKEKEKRDKSPAEAASSAVHAGPERRPMGVLSRFLPKGKKQEVRNAVQAAPEPEAPAESAEPDVIPQIMEETPGERICHTHYVMLKKTYGTQVTGPYMIQVWPTEVIEMHPDKVPSAIFVRAKAPNGTVICKTGDGHIKYVVLEIDRKQFNVFGFWENGAFVTEVVMINTTASMYTMNEEVEKECPEQVSDAFLDQFRSREPRRPEFFVVPTENVSHGEPFVPIAAFARVGDRNYVISNKEEGNTLRFTYANELSEISGRWKDGKFVFTIRAVEQE